MHEFPLTLRWEGSTATEYVRDAVAEAPGKAPIQVSAGASYGGNAALWNPEDLLGASLGTCHFLTFLALAKKYKLDVRSYADNVVVTLDTVEKVTKVTTIKLAPTIVVAAGTDPDKVREAFEKAHKYCFIAASITAEVVMAPTIEILG